MGLFNRVRAWFMNLFKSEAEKQFNVDIVSSVAMEAAQSRWLSTVNGTPAWVDKEGGIETINFAKFLCYYTSKKTCLDLKVTVAGSERADYINKCIKAMVDKSIRDKVEDACGVGGIIFKPNGTYNPSGAIDYMMPGDFAVTDRNSNGDILGAILIDRLQKGDVFYTRLEYHHFEDVAVDNGETVRAYSIENKAYRSQSSEALGNEIPLANVDEWSGIQPKTTLSNVEKPLFGYFKMPYNNTIDYASPEGVAIFSNCLKELEALDVAWSRKTDEVYDSRHMTFMSQRLIKGPRDKQNPLGKLLKLPRYVQEIAQGTEDGGDIHEHVATLLTEQRTADMNSILSMISTKSGFSQGQFVMDRKEGRVTATQIESDDSETIETITDMRTALKTAIKDLIYALDKYCDVFFQMPSGYVNALDDNTPDEDVFYFKDLLSTFEQDRTRAYQLMQAGVYSKIKYLTEYEGFSEAEAIKMLAEAEEEKKRTEQKGLFGDE